MDKETAMAIRQDFLVWSGGFPPESDQQIWVYVEAARPVETDHEEVATFLMAWMREEASADRGK
jgi:hypothetical protein